MIRKANHRPPTMVPANRECGKRQLRQCVCCWKLQRIEEGYDLARQMCRQCAAEMDAVEAAKPGDLVAVNGPVLRKLSGMKSAPSLWARFKTWLRGLLTK